MEQNKIRTYLLYAAGEIVLVVIGILIALQINNWNQQRIEYNQLQGYLNNISENIKDDLRSANQLNFELDQVSNIVTNAAFMINSDKEFYTAEDLTTYRELIQIIGNVEPFTPDFSGFDALKSTGSISMLQGTDMEKLLFFYYKSVTLAQNKEIRRINRIEELQKEFFISDFGIRNSTIWTQQIVENGKVMDKYYKPLKETFTSPVFEAIVLQGFFNSFRNDYLVIDYVGKAIIDLIENNTMDAEFEVLQTVESFYRDYSNEPIEEIVRNGSIPSSISIYTSSNIGPGMSFSLRPDLVELQYTKGLEWGAVMFVVDSLGIEGRPSRDYSSATHIEIELRSDKDKAIVEFGLKDRYDPDDGTEDRVNIELSSNWKTYRYNLRENFTTADLEKLHLLAGFVYTEGEELSIFVRNIKFILEDQ